MGEVAFVTGASWGIGKGIALALADAGFDAVVAARTRREGEGRERDLLEPAWRMNPDTPQ
jgi:NAD(P)-dependent dehydrogenase (short-subunit alcohol dehydrogenase family)